MAPWTPIYRKEVFSNCSIEELFIYVMYWRLPPRSGSFLRHLYLFSSLFGAGYTTKSDTQLGGNKTTEKIVDSVDPNVSSQFLKQYNQFTHQLGLQDNPEEKNTEDQDVEIIPEHPT